MFDLLPDREQSVLTMPMCLVIGVRSAMTNDRDVRHQFLDKYSESRLSDSRGSNLMEEKFIQKLI